MQLLAYGSVMGIKERSPSVVAQRSCPFRRADDVGEEDRRQDTFDLERKMLTGQELCNLNKDCIPARDRGEVAARKFDQLRPDYVVGEVTPLVDWNHGIVPYVENQRRDADEVQRPADVQAAPD